jgi:outer membrane protein OmpA-like peptidoglycan-associated protein
MRPAALVLSVLLCLSGPAAAGPLQMAMRSPVSAPDRPTLVLSAAEPVRDLQLTLRPGKPQTPGPGADAPETAPVRLSRRQLDKGDNASFPLGTGHPGRTLWQGEITYQVAGKPYHLQANFETLVTPRWQVTYDYGRLHLDDHYIEVRVSGPVREATISVLSDRGGQIGAGRADLSGATDTWLRIPWTPSGAGQVLRLDLTVTDQAGFTKSLQLVPWSESIPHREVHFATGSWDIDPAEQEKLDESYRLIAAVIARVRAHVTPKLYVSGHTDTVGSDADNLVLSRNRARAIAAYLQRKGLDVPVLYAGLGESMLKVQTADNVDEIRNRRADYVVAVEPPIRASWQRLGAGGASP